MRPRTISFEILALSLTLVAPCIGFSQPQEEPTETQTVQQVEERIDPLAAFLTITNIPARGILCGATGIVAGIVMGASAGRRYTDAAQMMEASCSGPWVITPEMVEESRSKQNSDGGKGSAREKRP